MIYPAIDAEDQAALNEIFGEGNFIGYVLKLENSGWHIDGILATDPPVYVVELYEENTSGANTAFVLASNDETLPGVTYSDFKTRLEEYLNGDAGSYSYQASYDRIVVTYTKNGATYETTVTPYTADGYGGFYHVRPNEGRFEYRTVTNNVYYISRMVISTKLISGDLVITKEVHSSLGEASEETFTFTLKGNVNGDYQAVYTSGSESQKTEQITFSGGQATIYLKDGETARISNLPINTTISIEETALDDYTTTYLLNGIGGSGRNCSVTISSTAQEVTFINEKIIAIPTGLHVNGSPWILMMGAAVVFFAGMGFFRNGRKGRKY